MGRELNCKFGIRLARSVFGLSQQVCIWYLILFLLDIVIGRMPPLWKWILYYLNVERKSGIILPFLHVIGGVSPKFSVTIHALLFYADGKSFGINLEAGSSKFFKNNLTHLGMFTYFDVYFDIKHFKFFNLVKKGIIPVSIKVHVLLSFVTRYGKRSVSE